MKSRVHICISYPPPTQAHETKHAGLDAQISHHKNSSQGYKESKQTFYQGLGVYEKNTGQVSDAFQKLINQTEEHIASLERCLDHSQDVSSQLFLDLSLICELLCLFIALDLQTIGARYEMQTCTLLFNLPSRSI